MSDLVSSARVARELGVTRSAISNWLKRGIIPRHLRPLPVDGAPPVWRGDLLPELLAWHEARHGNQWQVLELGAGQLQQLQPGDVVVKTDVPGRITIRRRAFNAQEPPSA